MYFKLLHLFIILIVINVNWALTDKTNENNLVKYNETTTINELLLKGVDLKPIVYNIKENMTISQIIRPLWIHGKKANFRINGLPCTCFNFQCGCCISIVLPLLKINETVCANLTYDAYLFAIVVDVTSNNNSIVHNVFSAKNPPAFCIPLQIIPTVPLDICIRLFDIYTPAVRNIHVCIDWEVKFYNANIIIVHFNCLRLGLDGAAIVRPGDDGKFNFDSPVVVPVQSESGIIYDEIDEDRMNNFTHRADDYLENRGDNNSIKNTLQ